MAAADAVIAFVEPSVAGRIQIAARPAKTPAAIRYHPPATHTAPQLAVIARAAPRLLKTI